MDRFFVQGSLTFRRCVSDQVDGGDHQVGVIDRLFYEFEQSQVASVLELCGTYVRGVDQKWISALCEVSVSRTKLVGASAVM